MLKVLPILKLYLDDKKVAKAVRQGNIDTITGTGWEFLDRFFYFLYSIKFFKITEQKIIIKNYASKSDKKL